MLPHPCCRTLYLQPEYAASCAQGLLNLTSHGPPDAVHKVLLFSSTAALLGPAGQANYAAANAALNAWSSMRTAAGGGATAVMWGAWASGMAAAQRGTLARLERLGMVAIPPAAGLRALTQILAAEQNSPQVCPLISRVIYRDHSSLQRRPVHALIGNGRAVSRSACDAINAPQVIANPFLWAKLQDSVRRTPMFAEFATAVAADASPPTRAIEEPAARPRRLTGFARRQLAPSNVPANVPASTAAAAAPISQDLVTEIQAVAAIVLGSAVAAKASFSEAGLDSLGEPRL